MQRESQAQVSPAVVLTVLAVVVVAIVAIGFMVLGRSGYRAQTAPTNDISSTAPQQGYKPPSGAPVNIGPGTGGSGGMPPMSGGPRGAPR